MYIQKVVSTEYKASALLQDFCVYSDFITT